MPTPAEIIAARVNGEILDHSSVSYAEDNDSFAENVQIGSKPSTPSIDDEVAFPALGGSRNSGNGSSSASSWGPSMKAAASSPSSASKSSSGNGSFKLSTIQEAFSLDADDQLNVARPEFIKILTSVKTDTKTNIECTTSQHTKKRTFLITGKPQDVKLAKRLVIKKLTKPVKITFSVPSKLRSRIIGPGGKYLKPIVQEYDVKVDIGNEEEIVDEITDTNDIFNAIVKVTIEGDVEGSKLAKTKILNIVKEETKNLSLKLPLDEAVKPFAVTFLDSLVSKYGELTIGIPDYKSASSSISIIGDRDTVLAARDEFRNKLDELAGTIIVEEVAIPKVKQQFLPIDTIMEEENVLIKLPGEGEANVKFIGQKSRVNIAKEKARKHTSQFKVEILDMSKAHKGNLAHVKAVAHLLGSTGGFAAISEDNDVVINVPSIEYLEDPTNNSIPIEVVAKVSDEEALKAAKRAIVSTVNSLAPADTKVIEDIDQFLIPKVSEIIAPVAERFNISPVVLGGKIILFSDSTNKDKDDFDFEDSAKNDEGFEAVDASLNVLRELKSSLQSESLSIPASQHKFIRGERNTTLNSILGEVEPNSVTVNFGGESKDQVVVHGIKPHVTTVKKLIESVLEDAEEHKDKYETIFPVPSSVLSRLIGKSGQFLNSLVDEFGVRIDVNDEDESKDKSDKVDIKLVGVKRNVESCKARISSITKKWADETLATLKIESSYHRRLIGPNRAYLSRLQDKYNVRIRFPSSKETSQDSPSHKDEVTIRGSSKNVAKAEEELLELYKFEKENGFEEVIKIPTKAIARVIGKSGETIKDIADGTGVEYRFKRDSAKEAETGIVELTLTGSKLALKEAVSKIKDIIEDVENFVSISIEVDPKYYRDFIGQGGSKMRSIISKAGGDELSSHQYYRLLSIPNEGTENHNVTSQGPKQIVNKIIEQVQEIVKIKEASVTNEFELPKEKHGLIIGPNGSIRHQLEEEFDVNIDIPREKNSTSIKLFGLPEQIEKLRAKLQELTKDDWNDVVEVPETYHSLLSERGGIFRIIKDDYNVEVSHGRSGRRANELSNKKLPNPPEAALPGDENTQKFTIVPSSSEAGEATIPWRLKGEKAQTDKVLKMLNEKLDLVKKSDFNGWFYSPNSSVFSKIVGPQGSRVREIRNKSNTFITVPRSNDKNANFIYLVGTEEGLKLAESLIKKTI